MPVTRFPADRTIAGVDGCKIGWVAVIARPGEQSDIATCSSFSELVESLPADTMIAVDMPIGLPDRIGRGRGPEALVRRHLGERQSSVFSIPSRAAVYAETGPFRSAEEWYAAHRRASAVARQTSVPPRAISIQAFGLFGKIREIDALLAVRPELRDRIIESHPEVAFWRLNGGRAMRLPKKIKGRVNPAGMEERRRLLAHCGVDGALLKAPPPRGVGEDDYLDATAMLLVAARHSMGQTISFPDPPAMDGKGIPISIRA